jgi:hypothetical protein
MIVKNYHCRPNMKALKTCFLFFCEEPRGQYTSLIELEGLFFEGTFDIQCKLLDQDLIHLVNRILDS